MANEKPKMSKGYDGSDVGSIDSNSPYYIHASEYPRKMQVNEGMTNWNYNDWAQEMKNFLFAKNKVGFINKVIKKLEEDLTAYTLWMCIDTMTKGW